MNPLKKDKHESTLTFCRKSIPDFQAVEEIINRYVSVASEKTVQLIVNNSQTVEGEPEHRHEVMTCQEFGSYLNQVFENVFSINDNATQGIQLLRKDIAQQYPQDQIIRSTELPEWMSQISKTSVLNRDFISLLTSLSAAHFYRHYHQMEGGLEEKPSVEGKCPTCGLAPHFGAIQVEEGFRDLECWLCGTKWRVNRLECLVCQENRQEKLGYFSIDETPHCRVHFCRSCQHYIKVFDLRQGAEKNPNLWILHLATLMCDDLAVSEGFMPASGVHWHTTLKVEANRLNIDNH